jgi:hypothetical protein
MGSARIAVAAVVLVAAAGCAGLGGEERAKYLDATATADVPEQVAVVSHENDTIDDVEPIQAVLADAAEGDDRGWVALSGYETEEVEQALSKLPRHDGTYARPGYYVRMGNRTYRIVVAVETG